MKDVMVNLARGGDIELRVFLAGGSEVELPYHCERVERRQLQRQSLVVVQGHHAGFPVEGRRFAPIVVGAFDAVGIGLQAADGNGAFAGCLSLPAKQQRCQSTSFAQGRDLVLVGRMLEPVHSVADKKSAGTEESTVGEVDTRR